MPGSSPFNNREVDATSDHSPAIDDSTLGLAADVTLGESIGAYKLLQLLGEGGFGSVYAAEQERPVRRRVALKVIKVGMDTRQVVARFEQERQALALMDHPHIAKVFDAGATESGRPYFVMELVRGEKITTFADRQRLTIPERLRLFVQACRAVQHAHQKGVIHRDLKPSNVLAGSEEGQGAVKVIDFGVAKATAARLTENTLYTEQRQIIGTPEYMSPEQAEGSPDIDTRTDVYSLGVLLYELLTGSTPFAERKLGSAAGPDVQRIIREVEPARPSTRIGKSERVREVASCRQSDPARLVSQVRGELDWIVLKTLEKDRSRRYDSAGALAADVERYLRGEPILAAPPSVGYRARKFVGRHRGAAAAAALLAASLLLGIGATTFMMFRAQAAEREQSKLRTAAELARKEETVARKRAEASNQFLKDMLTAADPGTTGREMTLREVLDQAAGNLDHSKAAVDPHVEVFLRTILGNTYTGLGALEEAERHLRQSQRIAVEKFGPESDEALDNQLDLAFVLTRRDRMQEADELAARTLGSYQRRYPADDEHVGAALKMLSNTRYRATGGQVDDALDLSRRALDIYQKRRGADDPLVGELLQQQAFLLVQQGKHAEAEPLARRALEIAEKARGPKHETTVSRWLVLYDAQFGLMKYGDAERSARTAAEISRELYGDEHPLYADALWRVGECERKLRKPEAEATLKNVVEIRRSALGRHTETALALAKLGDLYVRTLRLDEARAALEEALAIRRETLGAENPAVASSLSDLGGLDRRQRRFDDAISRLNEAIKIFQTTLGEDTEEVLTPQFELAMTYQDRGELDRAEAVFRERVQRVVKNHGENSYDHGHALDVLAPVLFQQGRVDEAVAMMRQTLAIYDATLGPTNPGLRTAVANLAFVLKSQGRLDESLELLERDVALCRQIYGDRNLETAGALLRASDVLRKQKKWPTALAYARDATSVRREMLPGDHPLAWQTPSAQIMVAALIADEAMDAAGGAAPEERGRRLAEADELLTQALAEIDKLPDPKSVPLVRQREIAEQAAQLYEARDQSEPGQGFDAKAREFREKLAALPMK